MSHDRTLSVDTQASTGSEGSNESSITPLSSPLSVCDQSFIEHVDKLKNEPMNTTDALVELATTLIANLAANDEHNNFRFSNSTLELHGVLREMLAHAQDCGGAAGRRYTAAAICSCAVGDDPTSEGTLEMLADLARTWVSHLLFICKWEQNKLYMYIIS
jgi:hypothetical protein